METLCSTLKRLRLEHGYTIKSLADEVGIHPSLLSRIEKGDRLPTREQMDEIIKSLELDSKTTWQLWYAEKIIDVVGYQKDPRSIFEIAESRIEYLRSKSAMDTPGISDHIQKKLDTIDQLKAKYSMHSTKNTIGMQKMRDWWNTAYTYESNRIEGNTLTFQETMFVVVEGMTISGKSLREHLEAINHAEAIAFIMDLLKDKIDLSARTLSELHGLILRGIDRENAGKYRKVPVRIGGSEHMPPQPYLLDKLMEDYFINYTAQKSILHPVILAAEMHERLVSIHPFIDGNGRTARLVMNLILLQHGYTIANLKGDYDSRMRYYTALERVQADADPEPFFDLITDACIESLEQHIEQAEESV
ncbi:MAG: Fic family protein [Bacteroidia bacterium]|nr:Fic family protein [Bacteroidia bacterium]